MTQRSIIVIIAGVIIFNLAFSETFLFNNTEETIEEIVLPEETEQPLRQSSVLAALVSPEPENNNLSLLQNNSIISSAAPSAIPGKEIIYYEVRIHDAVSTIAARFGISTNTVLWANGLKQGDYILPGQQLIILPVNGVMHKIKHGDTLSSIALKYKSNLAKITKFNELETQELKIGQEIIIPDGKMQIKKTSTYVNAKLPSLKGYFTYPTTGRISQGLHPHNAIDVANSCGTPIYAAASGTITIADAVGWNGGAGKYIKIKHSNGTETLYAHLDKFLVKQGSAVQKGQEIGLMGHTGRTIPSGPRGCHLHFSVYGAKNPLAK